MLNKFNGLIITIKINVIGHTLLKDVISPFIVGVLDKEFVRAHLDVDKSMPNFQEGTRAAFLEEVITMFSHKEDWIMEFDPPCGEISVVLLDLSLCTQHQHAVQ